MKISVIVPVRDEEESIRQLLDGLLNQTLKPDEIIITDGGSCDATPDIIAEYAGRDPRIRLIREKVALPGRGRNIAATQASNEWLAFIDGGVCPANDWLAQLAKCAKNNPASEVIYGAWEPVTDSFFKECAAIVYAYVPTNEINELFINSRAVMSSLMRRLVWSAVGGFSEDLRSAEDLLFMNKIDEAGFHVSYTSHAVVRWNMQPTFWRTFKRFVTYSRYNLCAGLGGLWHRAIFVRYLLLLLCTLLLRSFTNWWLAITATLFILMILVRSVAALRRNRRRYAAGWLRNCARILLLIPIIVTLDAATIVGAFDWLVR